MDLSEFDKLATERSPLKDRRFADFTDAEKTIWFQSHFNLCGGPEAIICLIRSVQHVIKNNIPGALVECGVWWGGNIEVMIRTLHEMNVTDREIYLYDTFAGMPKPAPVDDEGLNSFMLNAWQSHRGTISGSDLMNASEEIVRNRLAPLNYPRLHFVKGMVEDTIPGILPDQIAILRLDTDFYSSTKHELTHMYPRLSRGGILINDDYGAMPGSRKATDEYNAQNRLGWFLHRVDAHVRMVVKP